MEKSRRARLAREHPDVACVRDPSGSRRSTAAGRIRPATKALVEASHDVATDTDHEWGRPVWVDPRLADASRVTVAHVTPKEHG